MQVRVRMIGRPALSRRLQALEQGLAPMLAIAGEAAALPLENRWKELAPFRTGTYRRSIHHELGAVAADHVEVLVGTDIVDPPYPFFLEFGTSRMPPHPSARPALDESAPAMAREFSEAMAQLMARIR